MDVCKFRFNKSFHLIGAEEFLKDLFNDANVIKNFAALNGLSAGSVTDVKFTHYNCNVMNMQFFDVFKDQGLVHDNGYIRGNYEERVEGMVLGDRVRQALCFEDYDDPDVYDHMHQDKYQKEFLMMLFQSILLGGSANQYEDNIQDYLKVVKLLYKDLVSVARDPDTGNIRVYSHVYKIHQIAGYENQLFTGKSNNDHPQNFLYVLVDPINWHVNFYYHKWVDHW